MKITPCNQHLFICAQWKEGEFNIQNACGCEAVQPLRGIVRSKIVYIYNFVSFAAFQSMYFIIRGFIRFMCLQWCVAFQGQASWASIITQTLFLAFLWNSLIEGNLWEIKKNVYIFVIRSHRALSIDQHFIRKNIKYPHNRRQYTGQPHRLPWGVYVSLFIYDIYNSQSRCISM